MKRKCQNRKRVVMSTCRAVVPCDTERLRKARLARYARRKKVLEKLDGECRQFLEVDEPEFTKFMARTFGVEQNAERELEGKIGLCRRRLGIIELLARAHRKSPKAYCFELRGKVTETMDFWAVLEAELKDYSTGSSGFDDDDEDWFRETERILNFFFWTAGESGWSVRRV